MIRSICLSRRVYQVLRRQRNASYAENVKRKSTNTQREHTHIRRSHVPNDFVCKTAAVFLLLLLLVVR